jgi:hypothetical protein
MTKEDLINQLKVSDVTIVFTKKDGTERTMIATLDPSKLPVRESIEPKEGIRESIEPKEGKREVSTDAIAVVDTEIGQWRSFNFSNVISINGELL